jgi:23S rRNA (uridine2552-2'-O)-methyltransferase
MASKGKGKTPSQGPTGGQRMLRVRVKTAAKRTTSSARWLERQLNDPYVAASKR